MIQMILKFLCKLNKFLCKLNKFLYIKLNNFLSWIRDAISLQKRFILPILTVLTILFIAIIKNQMLLSYLNQYIFYFTFFTDFLIGKIVNETPFQGYTVIILKIISVLFILSYIKYLIVLAYNSKDKIISLKRRIMFLHNIKQIYNIPVLPNYFKITNKILGMLLLIGLIFLII